MKKSLIISMFLTVAMVLVSFSVTFAEEADVFKDTLLITANPSVDTTIKVVLNDKKIDFTDENGDVVEPQIINDRTMVPMRKIFEVFGAEIEWNGETKEVTAITPEKKLILQINNTKATVTSSGENPEEMLLDSAPVIVDGRTLVPIRFIAESLNLKVGWDSATKTVAILDTSFIMDNLEEKIPLLIELCSLSNENSTSEEQVLSATGTIKYTNAAGKENNTNLKIIVDGNIKENTDAALADISIKTTGKGSLLDEVKKAKLEKATMNILLDKEKMISYVKSTLLESSDVGENWLAMDLNDKIESVQLFETNDTFSLDDMIASIIDNVEITPNTYYQINEVIDLLGEFFGEKHLEVVGRTTKTYSYKITLEEIITLFGIEKADFYNNVGVDDASASIEINIKVENNTLKSINVMVSGNLSLNHESIAFDLSASSKVTNSDKKITIEFPAEKEITYVEE